MTDPTGKSEAELEFVSRPISQKARSALALRVAGADIEEIMETVGFASVQEAGSAIDRALRDQLKSDPKTRERARDLANRRLERLLRSVWPKAINEDHPDHLAAVAKARELIGDHVKLLGLAAPAEMIVHNPDMVEIESWVMSVMGKDEDDIVEADVLSEDEDDEGFGGPALVPA